MRLLIALLAAIPLFAQAAPPGAPTPADLYFSSQNPNLTQQEKAAIAIGQNWQAGGAGTMQPVADKDGYIRFLHGAQQPSIVCAVLQVCDVELQPGEKIVGEPHGGDPRFTVDPAVHMVDGVEVQHLILKPLDVGLDTTLVVTTDRRTYHLRLRSHRTEMMPLVGFIYPRDSAAKWQALKSQEAKQRQEQKIPQTGEYLQNLSFAYDVSGSASWKPLRVYNDGVKTILQMPPSMAQTEAPTLLVLRKEGGIFSDDETVMVNYRVQGDRFIIDSLFEKAILISGVGSSQEKVLIHYTESLSTKPPTRASLVSNPMAFAATVPAQPFIEDVRPEVAFTAPTPKAVEQFQWEILASDGTLQNTLARWGRAASWDVQWKNIPPINNPGYVKLSTQDFLSAADYVLGKAKTAAKSVGLDLSVTAYPNNILVISKDGQK